MGEGPHWWVVCRNQLLDEVDAADGGAGAVVVQGVDEASFEVFKRTNLVAAADHMRPVDGCLAHDGGLGGVPGGRVAHVDWHGPVLDDVVAGLQFATPHRCAPAVAEHLHKFFTRDDRGGLNADVDVDVVGGGGSLGAHDNVPVVKKGVDTVSDHGLVEGGGVAFKGIGVDETHGAGGCHVKLGCRPGGAGPEGDNPFAVASLVVVDKVACDFRRVGTINATNNNGSGGSHDNRGVELVVVERRERLVEVSDKDKRRSTVRSIDIMILIN